MKPFLSVRSVLTPVGAMALTTPGAIVLARIGAGAPFGRVRERLLSR
jgi:hypothetical protein